jgi:hypothetical protein
MHPYFVPWDVSSSTATWSGDFLVLPDRIMVLGMRSRGSRHFFLTLMNEHTSGSDLLCELNRRFADDPIYGAKLLLFDRDPRVTQAVVGALEVVGIQVFMAIPALMVPSRG